ncbi:MAG TPA: hypothetical protein VNN07_15685, partial [Candidatus Tectomicrobia bacterium]|nr:hypothetical protein [Candidatus Tectomicrobia bacterium]
MRLYARIYLHALGVLVVAGVATAAVFAVSGRGGWPRDASERMARHVAGLVAERLDDAAGLRSRVERLHRDLDVDVTVLDAAGREMARAGQPVPASPADVLVAAQQGTTVWRTRPTPHAVVPVRRPGSDAVAGTVELALGRRFGPPGLLGPLAVVAVVLLAVAIATRPVARR